MENTYKSNYDFGKIEEDRHYESIKNYFNDNIVKCQERYSPYDFEGDTCIYELKSRSCNSDTYATTIIPVNKIISNINKNQIWLFGFRNGLYYIKYDEDRFKNYVSDMYVRNKRMDYNDKKTSYFFIPVEDLILICQR